MTVDSTTAIVGGTNVKLESAPVLRNGTTFVPIRFIAEKLGAKVEFDPNTRVVRIDAIRSYGKKTGSLIRGSGLFGRCSICY